PRVRGKEIRDRSSGSGAESGRISTSQRGSDRNPALFSILSKVLAGKVISCLGELEARALVRCSLLFETSVALDRSRQIMYAFSFRSVLSNAPASGRSPDDPGNNFRRLTSRRSLPVKSSFLSTSSAAISEGASSAVGKGPSCFSRKVNASTSSAKKSYVFF